MNSGRLSKIFITVLLITFAITAHTFALPKVDEVVSGNVQIELTDLNTMTINATDNSIINYSSFDIMENESVFVTLPSINSQILNRVTGNDPSDILGNLTSNGLFILVNEAGIHVGESAQIDAASLIFSTRDITNTNFLNGDYLFKKLSQEELDMLLLNEGNITIREGGFGVLIAGAVENRGIVTARVGKVVLAGGDAVKLNITGNKRISVEITEETASTILDYQGNPITEQIKNTGTLEAAGGDVVLKAESVANIFEKLINVEGIVKANKLEEKDGVIRIVADGDVAITAEVEATRVEVQSDTNIEVTGNVSGAEGGVTFLADADGDGVGEFTQTSGLIKATGEGDIHIGSSGEMTLGNIKTELGTIIIGAGRMPSSVAGEPYYTHTAGDFEITQVEEANGITTLHTSRGDVLKYSTTGTVKLEAANGKIVAVNMNVPLPGSYLELIASEFYINSAALTTHLTNNTGDMTIENITYIEETDLVTIKGQGVGEVTYLKTNNITFEMPRGDMNTSPGVVIPGNQVKVSAQKIGSYNNPVGITANLTYINRLQGDIDVSEMWGIGSTICIRGPAPDSAVGGASGPESDSWGAVSYDSATHLILESQSGSILSQEDTILTAQTLTLLAYGTIGTENSPINIKITTLKDVISKTSDIYLASTGDILLKGIINTSTEEPGTNAGNIGITTSSRLGLFGDIHADAVNGNGGNIKLWAGDAIAITPDSLTTANSELNGNGGEIIMFSPGLALFREGAKIEVKGGALSGDGGFIEVSGHEYVEIYGLTDTSAPNGTAGTFLIDPFNIDINATADANGAWNVDTWEPTSDGSVITPASILTQLNAGNTVIIDATVAGAGTGTITITSAIDLDGENGRLRFLAETNLDINAAITNIENGMILDLLAKNGIDLGANITDSADGAASDIHINADYDTNDVGAITQSAGEIDVSNDSSQLHFWAGTGIGTSGTPIQVRGTTNAGFSAATISGGIYITENGSSVMGPTQSADHGILGWDVDGIDSGTSDIVITNAGGTIAFAANGVIAGGNITLSTDSITAPNNAAAEITSTGTIDLTANDIGAANAVDITGATTLIISDAGAGAIQIDEITASAITTTTITVADNNSGTLDIDYFNANAVDINNVHAINSVDLSNATVSTFSYTATTGDITITSIDTGTANTTITATAGAIDGSIDDATADIVGATVTLTAGAGGIGTAVIPDITTTATTLHADTSADNSNIIIDSIGNFTGGTINAGTGNITIDSTGTITTNGTVTGAVINFGSSTDTSSIENVNYSTSLTLNSVAGARIYNVYEASVSNTNVTAGANVTINWIAAPVENETVVVTAQVEAPIVTAPTTETTTETTESGTTSGEEDTGGDDSGGPGGDEPADDDEEETKEEAEEEGEAGEAAKEDTDEEKDTGFNLDNAAKAFNTGKLFTKDIYPSGEYSTHVTTQEGSIFVADTYDNTGPSEAGVTLMAGQVTSVEATIE